MIMGNTEILLPSDVTENDKDPSFRIPERKTVQESRSVLKGESTICGSPRDITVMPAVGEQTLKSVTSVPDLIKHANGKKAVGKALSWANIARR